MEANQARGESFTKLRATPSPDFLEMLSTECVETQARGSLVARFPRPPRLSAIIVLGLLSCVLLRFLFFDDPLGLLRGRPPSPGVTPLATIMPIGQIPIAEKFKWDVLSAIPKRVEGGATDIVLLGFPTPLESRGIELFEGRCRDTGPAVQDRQKFLNKMLKPGDHYIRFPSGQTAKIDKHPGSVYKDGDQFRNACNVVSWSARVPVFDADAFWQQTACVSIEVLDSERTALRMLDVCHSPGTLPKKKAKLGMCAGGGKAVIPKDRDSQSPYDYMIQNIVYHFSHGVGKAIVYLAHERRREVETYLAPWIRDGRLLVVCVDNDKGMWTGDKLNATSSVV